uniref:Uncharacterized protein n=1 Tax=Arundo donax TaxID=35708 RepID=A0A0A9B6P6_ARUDO
MKNIWWISFMCFYCSVPCAASSNTRTGVPEFKVAATPTLPLIFNITVPFKNFISQFQQIYGMLVYFFLPMLPNGTAQLNNKN